MLARLRRRCENSLFPGLRFRIVPVLRGVTLESGRFFGRPIRGAIKGKAGSVVAQAVEGGRPLAALDGEVEEIFGMRSSVTTLCSALPAARAAISDQSEALAAGNVATCRHSGGLRFVL